MPSFGSWIGIEGERNGKYRSGYRRFGEVLRADVEDVLSRAVWVGVFSNNDRLDYTEVIYIDNLYSDSPYSGSIHEGTWKNHFLEFVCDWRCCHYREN